MYILCNFGIERECPFNMAQLKFTYSTIFSETSMFLVFVNFEIAVRIISIISIIFSSIEIRQFKFSNSHGHNRISENVNFKTSR